MLREPPPPPPLAGCNYLVVIYLYLLYLNGHSGGARLAPRPAGQSGPVGGPLCLALERANLLRSNYLSKRPAGRQNFCHFRVGSKEPRTCPLRCQSGACPPLVRANKSIGRPSACYLINGRTRAAFSRARANRAAPMRDTNESAGEHVTRTGCASEQVCTCCWPRKKRERASEPLGVGKCDCGRGRSFAGARARALEEAPRRASGSICAPPEVTPRSEALEFIFLARLMGFRARLGAVSEVGPRGFPANGSALSQLERDN